LNLDLLKGKAICEAPWWFQLILIILMAAFLIGMVFVLQKWAILTLVINKLTGINWLDLLKFGKGRSP